MGEEATQCTLECWRQSAEGKCTESTEGGHILYLSAVAEESARGCNAGFEASCSERVRANVDSVGASVDIVGANVTPVGAVVVPVQLVGAVVDNVGARGSPGENVGAPSDTVGASVATAVVGADVSHPLHTGS